MTNVGTETAFRHATMASISKKVNISWGQRSVDAITGLERTRGVVYRQKQRGEEARGFSTVRGAPQNGDGRTCMGQAEP